MRSFPSLVAAASLLAVVATAARAAGDPEAGQAKAQACAACHGADGNSADPNNPKLAAQVPGYIAAQLAAFKSGARANNAIMAGMAAPLSDEDMRNLDAYYASRSATPGAVSEANVELAREGEKVFRGGYRPMEIAACMSCHGPTGSGIPPLYPRVAGQHAAYLESTLLAYKSGERTNAIMNDIAFRLSGSQIKALATYMQGLD